jgi:hypothetical protein
MICTVCHGAKVIQREDGPEPCGECGGCGLISCCEGFRPDCAPQAEQSEREIVSR